MRNRRSQAVLLPTNSCHSLRAPCFRGWPSHPFILCPLISGTSVELVSLGPCFISHAYTFTVFLSLRYSPQLINIFSILPHLLKTCTWKHHSALHQMRERQGRVAAHCCLDLCLLWKCLTRGKGGSRSFLATRTCAKLIPVSQIFSKILDSGPCKSGGTTTELVNDEERIVRK